MYQVLYAATKSFISSFGASLAAEVRELGIDVLVFHPSPVATRFYDKVELCCNTRLLSITDMEH